MKEIDREAGVHGRAWDHMHGGYFADPAVAAPLLDVVAAAVARGRPDVIADLGGGTGFLLGEILRRDLAPASRLVNADASVAQLEQVRHPRLSTVCVALDELRRAQLAQPGERLLFLMRSVLHYAGRDGLNPLLARLRAQLQPGEGFVHQTACFEEARDAECINRLYALLRTGKWYPTEADLRVRLAAAGWSVTATAAAASLPLSADELGERYHRTPAQLAEIRRALLEEFGDTSCVFDASPTSFCAYLPYTIFSCLAA